MIEKQNVTLSLPKNILRQAKMLALEKETSLSGLMVDLLLNLIEQEDRYAQAKQAHLRMLAEKVDLGTEGHINWTRESLYERE